LDGVIVLALNSGSSSLKFGLYRVTASSAETLISGQVEEIQQIGECLASRDLPAPDAIGHRVVHGGPRLRQHCLIDENVLRELEAAAAFAPLHTPATIAIIRFAREHFPKAPQAACFDTAFHAGLPDVARTLPIAKALRNDGIQRYGFHGLSCESIVRHLADDLPDRLLIAHLGAGASVTAVKAGKSIDTSMGLTPSGGMMMGARSGDLDPGILIYLMRTRQFDAAQLETLIDRHSGLCGISGVGGDMRQLREAAADNADAHLAIQMFCYSARKQIAAMIAVLDGVDALVFTGGIGENDAATRSEISRGLAWIGIDLNVARNQRADNPINGATSRCRVLVVPSREDEQIARHTWTLCSGTSNAR
jgi:acetate kinase